ncbi:MAG: M48 family metallopeptidase [Marinilabiliaceae bacterium]|jgi:predicted Zn-dependent protease|nr:M48 family metallopeptidase [Marinilabiliaceae bacterium]
MNYTERALIMILLVSMVSSCSTVPITGRKQVNLLPESEMIAMGFSSYSEFMNTAPLSSNTAMTSMVKEVGSNISGAVIKYFDDNGLSSRIEGYEWELNLFADDTPNAWAMPGGKIAVYEGILPYTRSQEGLAVVVGHEIAHIVARHGNERMSQQLLVQLGGIALNEALNEKPEETRNIFLAVYGVGTQVGGILPYSREHEKEADKLGLIFMAMAGYDPSSAIEFWERMAEAGGSKPPEFLSTHPSDASRIAEMKKNLPEAMKYYNK